MPALTGQSIASSYEQLLHLDDNGGGNGVNLLPIYDGDNGTQFALQIATDAICVDNPTTSSSSQGGKLRLQSDDGAVMGSGHRLGVIEFGGAEDTSNTITTGARIEAITDDTWSSTENGAYLRFFTTDGNASQSEQLRITAEGRIGINDTTPDARLDVYENKDDGWIAIFEQDHATGYGVKITGDMTGTDPLFEIESVTDTVLRVEGNGKVGIGTDAPQKQFEIEQDLSSGGGTLSLACSETTVVATNLIGQIYFRGRDVDTYATGAKIVAMAENTWGDLNSDDDDAPASLRFYTQSDGNGDALGNAAMIIDENQNVGIGTENPLHRLVIKSSTSGASDVPSYIALEDDNAVIHGFIGTCWNVGDTGYQFLHMGSSYYNGSDWITNYGTTYGSNNVCQIIQDSDGIRFLTENATGNSQRTDSVATFNGYERMRVDIDTGNIGIGTTSPDTKLEVVGSFAANGPSSTFITMSSGDTHPDVSGGNIFKTHSDGVTIDQFDGGVCGQIITIISGGATVYDVTSSELKGGTTNITTAAGDVTMWVCESATVWHLLSWMDLSVDLSSGGF
jgi:hypothetical protein